MNTTRRSFLKSAVAATAVIATGIEVPAIAEPAKREPFPLEYLASLGGNIAFQSGITLFLCGAKGASNGRGGYDVTLNFDKEKTDFLYSVKYDLENIGDGKFQIAGIVSCTRVMQYPPIDAVRIHYKGKMIGAMKSHREEGNGFVVWFQDEAEKMVYPLDPWGAQERSKELGKVGEVSEVLA